MSQQNHKFTRPRSKSLSTQPQLRKTLPKRTYQSHSQQSPSSSLSSIEKNKSSSYLDLAQVNPYAIHKHPVETDNYGTIKYPPKAFLSDLTSPHHFEASFISKEETTNNNNNNAQLSKKRKKNIPQKLSPTLSQTPSGSSLSPLPPPQTIDIPSPIAYDDKYPHVFFNHYRRHPSPLRRSRVSTLPENPDGSDESEENSHLQRQYLHNYNHNHNQQLQQQQQQQNSVSHLHSRPRSRSSSRPASVVSGRRSPRKLVRRERAQLGPGDAHYYYTQHTLESDSLAVQPSLTGIDPLAEYVTSADFRIMEQGPVISEGTEEDEEEEEEKLEVEKEKKKGNEKESSPESVYPNSIYKTPRTSPRLEDEEQMKDTEDEGKKGKEEKEKKTNKEELKEDSKPLKLVKSPKGITDGPFFKLFNNSKLSLKSSTTLSASKYAPALHQMFPQRHLYNRSRPPTPGAPSPRHSKDLRGPSVWQIYCNIITLFVPAISLRWCGMRSKPRQQAWREKIGLVSVIILLTTFVGFFTFAFNSAVCGQPVPRVHYKQVPNDSVVVHGALFNITKIEEKIVQQYPDPNDRPKALDIWEYAAGADASLLFQNVNGHCRGVIWSELKNHPVPMTQDMMFSYYYPCVLLNLNGSPRGNPLQHRLTHQRGGGRGTSWGHGPDGVSANAAFCHLAPGARDYLYTLEYKLDVYYEWSDLRNINNDLVVYLGDVIDLTRLQMLRAFTMDANILRLLEDSVKLRGKDISVMLSRSASSRAAGRCLVELAKIGVVDTDTLGCIASNLVLIISLTFIVSIVVVKFVFALYFEWFMSARLGANFASVPLTNAASGLRSIKSGVLSAAESLDRVVHKFTDSRNNSRIVLDTFEEEQMDEDEDGEEEEEKEEEINTEDSYSSLGLLSPSQMINTICLVTAYSEDEEGLRATLDSIATCSYPYTHKLVIVICDGLIIGSGNGRSTPEIAVSMIKDFLIPPRHVGVMPYIAVAQGAKRFNMAKVYAGHYDYDDTTVPVEHQVPIPIVCIVKCGDAWERETHGVKPGNRGKRDSQVMLMSFLQKVMFNERMTDLEHALYYNIWQLTRRDVMDYETVLMVDADTRICRDSVEYMVGCFVQDPMIMGLCGETQIANKTESWVTMIQVFEYFISHHLTKSFESVFGGVTCLPGCFSMYRIKAPKGPRGYWVPILANPDVVERYAINSVETLHEKNLLLLGEDRYLSTLMLKTFPNRKQMFVPQAKCETVAPSEFKVLLDQRRRWINSTVHNLMELIIVRDLCGVFCISMQFVVLIEFIGTLTLPASLLFSVFVMCRAVVERPVPVIPLILLALIVGIPGLLIVVTAHQWTYVLWMLIYLISLPIWNFILPLNAFWRFDDFSWGNTRVVQEQEVTKTKTKTEDENEDDKDDENDVIPKTPDARLSAGISMTSSDLNLHQKQQNIWFDESRIRLMKFHEWVLEQRRKKRAEGLGEYLVGVTSTV
ncbi:uncharacterized protein SAPINGB_P004967 [Magnusiomyces paraingens]|uniref:chitin synthase n=1 Tax=Magnusiomyces paraingens TaxID=2606893 RepID=A0A5E8BXX6_9ASCO|nr:uncharacterized protein SAPINGB_P004967 [Saprochaete ingens]VVT56323.1 unnamed protein product [Saprochaete ingens]